MQKITIKMPEKKRVVLIAHDAMKKDMVEWAEFNKDILSSYELYGTGTTCKILKETVGLDVRCFKSGPLGGDQQVGAKIAENEIDAIVFFSDPLDVHPHSSDVSALLRIAVVYNIPIACNRASADFMIASPLMHQEYERLVTDYDNIYLKERTTEKFGIDNEYLNKEIHEANCGCDDI
ncbi:MAG: methylglyoxal synthase [Thermodesulfovibrionales bacterium]